MIAGVADTHAALWHLFGDPRLSAAASSFIEEAANSCRRIAVSSITLAEVVYLVEKRRIPPSSYGDLAMALADPEHGFTDAPLTADIVFFMRQVSREQIPDMPDRRDRALLRYSGDQSRSAHPFRGAPDGLVKTVRG